VTEPGYQAIFTCTGASSVTDNFGNRDNLGRGASEQQKE
jgi:hypothetical protein